MPPNVPAYQLGQYEGVALPGIGLPSDIATVDGLEFENWGQLVAEGSVDPRAFARAHQIRRLSRQAISSEKPSVEVLGTKREMAFFVRERVARASQQAGRTRDRN